MEAAQWPLPLVARFILAQDIAVRMKPGNSLAVRCRYHERVQARVAGPLVSLLQQHEQSATPPSHTHTYTHTHTHTQHLQVRNSCIHVSVQARIAGPPGVPAAAARAVNGPQSYGIVDQNIHKTNTLV